jgi:hypothetical protein
MNRAVLQALTWGTVLAAVLGALLIAAAGDEADWRDALPWLQPAPGTAPAAQDDRAAVPPRGGRP